MIFDKLIERLKQGVNISINQLEPSEDFKKKYKEYQDRSSKYKNKPFREGR